MQGIAQKILSDPGKYSIQQLTQAVQNGTLPAYIGVPIIQDKVQEQKKLQMMQHAQQTPQNAPPIAQQIMQEARGVEALPTNLPQQYAGGGIIAFEEGGEVERYQNKGYVYETPYDRMNRENRERAEAEKAARLADLQERGMPTMSYGEQMRNVGSALVNAPITAFKTLVGAPGDAQNPQGYGITRLLAPDAVKPYDPTTATRRSQYTNEPYPSANANANTNTGPAKDKSGLGLGGDSALGRKPGLGLKEPIAPDLVGQTNTLLKEFTARDEKRLADLDLKVKEAEGKVTGKAYEGLESSLKKEAEEFGADRAQAKNMAIFKAGLAMMAGTSRHALENIGKGAMVGAEDYQAAAKDIKKAQKENDRAMAMVEQARRAEALGDRDKSIERMYKANEHFGERDKFGTSAVMNATGKNAELSNDIWKTQFNAEKSLQQAEITGRYGLQAAQVRANRESGITPYQMARLRGDAEKRVDPDAVRAQLAKSLGLTKTPAPGADKGFDSKFNTLYENEVASYINRVLGAPGGGGGGGGGADPYAGYKLVR